MNKIYLALAFLFLLGTSAFSQDLIPAPSPTPPDDNDVVKISTNLIQLDVSVTDSKGKPIPDLNANEIEIYENGKKQDITNFSFILNQIPVSKSDSKEKNKNPILPSQQLKRESIKRTVALVVDDLTMGFSEMRQTRDALKKFVNEQMQDGDLVAIIRTGAGIGALQQFTSDKRILFAAIEKLRFNMIVTSRNSAFNPISATLAEESSNPSGRDLGDRIQTDKEFDNEVNEFRESIFASGTLGAVNYVIRGMKDLPGRKSVMLLSSGFRLLDKRTNGMTGPSRVLDSLQRLTDLANRSSVVIYTIDVRGVTFDGLTGADDTNGLTADQIESRISDRQNEVLSTQEGLRYLARQTGGFPYFLNGISQGIRKALDDQSYYLIGYEPDSATFDPKKNRFNKIEIKVKRKGVKVRYRSGFFGFSEEQIAKPTISPNQALYNALSSPFAVNDISLRLNSLYTGVFKKESYMRSFLHIDANNLTFEKLPDGKYKSSFDLVMSTFGDSGKPEQGERSTFTLDISEEMHKTVLKKGLVYDFTFKSKKSGAYQMRVAIRDNATNRVGSASQFIEIPNLKKNRLTLSGVFLENVDFANWKKLDKITPEEAQLLIDLKSDTAMRKFTPGTVLTYSADVFNAKLDKTNNANLTLQARLYSEQNMVFDGKPVSLGTGANEQIPARGSILLGTEMASGNYTLQLIVTDNNAKTGRNTAVQFVSFELAR